MSRTSGANYGMKPPSDSALVFVAELANSLVRMTMVGMSIAYRLRGKNPARLQFMRLNCFTHSHELIEA